MTTWFTSDNHFNHRKIAKYCGRPPGHEALMWKGLKRVEAEDTLVHLGDLILYGSRQDARNTVLSLPGSKKVLVEGNHDRRTRIRTSEAWDEVVRYMNIWRFVRDGFHVAVSHRPHELVDVIADIKIHGHVHDKGEALYIRDGALWVNVCVEQWDYRPVSWIFIKNIALRTYAKMSLPTRKRKGTF